MCHRQAAGAYKIRTSRNGTPCYFHHHPNAPEGPPAEHKPRPARTAALPDDGAAGPDECHRLYSLILGELSLHKWHRARIKKERGLTDEQITEAGYKTWFGLLPQKVVDAEGEALKRLPGFWVDEQGVPRLGTYLPQYDKSPAGYLVPVRDPEHRIVALKIRSERLTTKGGKPLPKYAWISAKKRDGYGPGNPAHVPVFANGPAELVRLTEGEIKADVATVLSGVPTVAAPGAADWRVCLTALEALEARTVRVAFDADWRTNKAVAAAMLAALLDLPEHGFAVEAEVWPPEAGKGIDDVLVAGRGSEIGVVSGEDLYPLISELRKVAEVEPGLFDGGKGSGGWEDGNFDEPPGEGQDGTGGGSVPEDPNLLADPGRLAGVVAKSWSGDSGPTRRFYRGQWFRWRGARYATVDETSVKPEVTGIVQDDLTGAYNRAIAKKEPDAKAVPVSTRLVGDVLQALQARLLVHEEEAPSLPAWIGGDRTGDVTAGWEADDVIAAPNGLVHLPGYLKGLPKEQYVAPPDPRFFTTNAIGFNFTPESEAPEPVHWLRFLGSVWPDDPESIRALRLWFGYMLTGGTWLQKGLALIGPPRSGKGTIVKALRELVGADAVAGTSMSQLAGQFGMAGLIGKSVAVIDDARTAAAPQMQAVVERLLTIVGEGSISVPRKNRLDWQGGLRCRVMLMSNELPRFADPSGACANRFVVLRMTETFLGREDTGLADRLGRELPGILTWAMRGLVELRAAGRIDQPASALGLVRIMEEEGAPVRSFLNESYVQDLKGGPKATERDHSIECAALYAEFVRWSEGLGNRSLKGDRSFGRDLVSVFPKVERKQKRVGKRRIYHYWGIREKTEEERDQDAEVEYEIGSGPEVKQVLFKAQGFHPE